MKTISTLIFIAAFSNAFSQLVVYNGDGKSHYIKEDVDLNFKSSSVKIQEKKASTDGILELFPAAAALIPSVIDLGFKITTDVLESRKEKFSGEYQVQKSYLQAGDRNIPELTFTRTLTVKEHGKVSTETALKIELKPIAVGDTLGFVYYVSSIELVSSKAKWKQKNHALDYTIEIIPTLSVNNEKKQQELAPISMTGIEFGKHDFDPTNAKYRTEFIPTPPNALFLDAGMKIVESNPAKIKAEKILEMFNDYQDDAKSFIKHFLPSEEE